MLKLIGAKIIDTIFLVSVSRILCVVLVEVFTHKLKGDIKPSFRVIQKILHLALEYDVDLLSLKRNCAAIFPYYPLY